MSDRWRPAAGANPGPKGVEFAVWAPNAESVEAEVVSSEHEAPWRVALEREADGWFRAIDPLARAGSRYGFRLDGNAALPDPYSRFQPDGVHGLSEVIDPLAYRWGDDGWTGVVNDNLIIYELHVGTMTDAGTFEGVIGQLDALSDLGINLIELMPVAQCPGERNWGYDGVDLFAPSHAYGRPDDLRRLVDEAHRRKIGVILDVVYNHLGPEGNYLHAYADAYFTDRHPTPWGDGFNWDGPASGPVRQFAIDNACAWVAEYHIDGFRMDATHALIDDSPVHIVRELTERARDLAAPRSIVVFAEDGRHEITRARPLERGGEGLDGIWADDFHHELRVLLTNARENYYASYTGTTTAIGTAITTGMEQDFTAEGHPVGTPITANDPAAAFVFCIQNHDQVGNRPFGDRLHHEISVDRYLVASTLLLFAPETPLLFMGQEFASSSPFLYFTDHPENLGRLVTEGRRNEFAGFRAFHDEQLRETIPDPQARSTFLRSKLDLTEREVNAGVLHLYTSLIEMRRSDPVLRANDRLRTSAHGVTAEVVLVHRWADDEHRLLVANFGSAITLPAAGNAWNGVPPMDEARLLLATSDRQFGGTPGTPRVEKDGTRWAVTVPGRSATIWSLTT